jgi:hypothetical protein
MNMPMNPISWIKNFLLYDLKILNDTYKSIILAGWLSTDKKKWENNLFDLTGVRVEAK